MKAKLKAFICKHFGCSQFTEIYAVRGSNRKYMIKENTICSRCEKMHTKYLATGLSRVDLLKQEWFIIDNYSTKQINK